MLKNHVFIITGKQGEGKTLLLTQVISLLAEKSLPISGFVAKGYWENGQRVAFDLMDIQSAKTIPLCYKNANNEHGFTFSEEALQYGYTLLKPRKSGNKVLFVIDEVGKMELKEKVWYNAIQDILTAGNNLLLITVRDRFVRDVLEKFGLANALIITLPTMPETIVKEMLEVINL